MTVPRIRTKRTLYLIRHGQHDAGSDTKFPGTGLTSLGRRQARLTAARLRALPIRTIFHSTALRAIETADAVASALPRVPRRAAHVLLEVPDLLWPPSRPGTPKRIVLANRARAESAFRRYFRRPRGGDCTELLVCHGNLIRYLVCRVLAVAPVPAFIQMETHNCGLTEVAILSNGRMRLVTYNDVAHLPLSLRTVPVRK
jgi:broad specificity phosphatase PhoE